VVAVGKDVTQILNLLVPLSSFLNISSLKKKLELFFSHKNVKRFMGILSVVFEVISKFC